MVILASFGFAQIPPQKKSYTLADSLRGSLTSALRTCYDVDYYHLSVKINPDSQSISGSNLFKFTATKKFDQLQFDLFDNLSVDKILYHQQKHMIKCYRKDLLLYIYHISSLILFSMLY